MNNITGKPVYGDDFYGRESDILRIRQRLRSDNVLLLGPRRVGKTSLTHALLDQERSGGGHGIYSSVADLTTEMDFVRALLREARSLEPGLLDRFRAHPTIAELLRRAPKDLQVGDMTLHFDESDWRHVAESLLRTLQKEERLLIAIDEFPNLVLRLAQTDQQRARSFLDWFRDVRISRTYASLRWILTGSIGLDAVLRQHGLLASVNDLLPSEGLGAFSEPTAHAFVQGLFASYRYEVSDELVGCLLEAVGWPLPYFLQLISKELLDLGRCPMPADVVVAKEQLLRRHSAFEHWRSRLSEQHGETVGGHARALLNKVAESAKPVSLRVLNNLMLNRITNPDAREELLGQLLLSLETDGYVVRLNDSFAFRSGLLKQWWQRNYV